MCSDNDIPDSDDDDDIQSSTITLEDAHPNSRDIFKQLPHMKEKAIILYYINVLKAPSNFFWYGPNGVIVKIIKALKLGRVTNYIYSCMKKIRAGVY